MVKFFWVVSSSWQNLYPRLYFEEVSLLNKSAVIASFVGGHYRILITSLGVASLPLQSGIVFSKRVVSFGFGPEISFLLTIVEELLLHSPFS